MGYSPSVGYICCWGLLNLDFMLANLDGVHFGSKIRIEVLSGLFEITVETLI